VLGAALLLALLCTCASAFDFEKAKRLSPEKRSEYDVIFFNEMMTWNLNSNRYVTDSQKKRKAEFEQMAADGYFPAYAALRLVGIVPAAERNDPEALAMLLAEAKKGEPSSMCAVAVIPTKTALWGSEKKRIDTAREMMVAAARRGHGHCLGSYGGALLRGNISGIGPDRENGMALLLESARQGYYRAASILFNVRMQKVLAKQFDFEDDVEVRRALCWGRLAQQHTNWAGFQLFLEELRNKARPDQSESVLKFALKLDPRTVPITQQAVTPGDCIRIEKEG
jgi:hypothetical protein